MHKERGLTAGDVIAIYCSRGTQRSFVNSSFARSRAAEGLQLPTALDGLVIPMSVHIGPALGPLLRSAIIVLPDLLVG